MRLGYALLVLGLLLFMQPALALRCGNKLVSEGDHQLKIQKYCGEPAAIKYRTIYRSGIPANRYRRLQHDMSQPASSAELLIHNRSLVEVQIEEWTYNFGPRRLMRVIRFENGVVTDVSNLGYGFID
jgi:hypothetical protein